MPSVDFVLLNHYIQKGDNIYDLGPIDENSLLRKIRELSFIRVGADTFSADGFFLVGVEDSKGNFMEFTRKSDNIFEVRISKKNTNWSDIYDVHSSDLSKWLDIIFDPSGEKFEDKFDLPEITNIDKKGFHVQPVSPVPSEYKIADSDMKLLDKGMGGLGDGLRLFEDSLVVLFRHPILLLPLLFSWFFVASSVLYVRYYLVFPSSIAGAFFLLFVCIFFIAFIISASNLLMLEFVQQVESNEKLSLRKALKELMSFDIIRVLPIVCLWASVWFIIAVIKITIAVIKSKSKSRSHYHSPKPSLRDAARTLGGVESGPFTWLGLGLDMFSKLVRMAIFLSLPAIAWENKSANGALSKAKDIIRKHPIQFLTEYTLTGLAILFMAIPLVFIFAADDAGAQFSDSFWAMVIIYESIVWILNNYMEQMSVALLYLWHIKWEKVGGKGSLSLVTKPSLLDEQYEFAKKL